MASYIDHNSKFCSIEKQKIPKQQRTYNAQCPFCGVPLPVMGRSVRLTTEEGVGGASEVVPAPPKPLWKNPGPVIFVAVAAIILVMAALNSSGSTTRTRSPSVASSALSQEANRQIDRIESMTSCSALQAEFDIADRNHAIQTERSNLELMKVATEYMKAADNQMRRVGCYG